MIQPHQLRRRLYDANVLTDGTLEIWCYCLNYIFANGWTDITDSSFVKDGKERFGITSQSLFRHLRRLRKRGVLVGHRMILEDDTFTRIYDHTPRVFVRYTFPGMHQQELETRIESRMFETRGHDSTPKEDRYWNEKFSRFNQKAEQAETQQPLSAALFSCSPVDSTPTP